MYITCLSIQRMYEVHPGDDKFINEFNLIYTLHSHIFNMCMEECSVYIKVALFNTALN